MNLPCHRISTLLVASALTLGLAALPIGFGQDLAPHLSAAFAGNGHGNGHGDGNGNGHGNGNANGHANDNSGDSDASDGSASAGTGADGDDDASASELGALNAAHASPQALAHASPNSRVGKIAAYKNAALAAQPADQAVADAQSAVDTATKAVDDATAALAAANTTGDPAQIATAQSALDA